MAITVTHPTIEEVFKDFYSIPAFQREYVWQEEHVEALLEDAFEALFDEAGKPIDTEYFIGSIVAYKESDVFQLIDGQQRITTLYIALCAIRDSLMEDGSEDIYSHLHGLIRATFQDDSGQSQSRFRLIPLYEDAGQELQNIAQNGLVEILDERKLPTSVKNMRMAYRTVRSFLNEKFSGEKKAITLFQARITRRVRLVRIETVSVSDALRIFETINDRGIGLNAMDLLKNLLFMRSDKKSYEALTKDWESTIRTIGEAKEKPLRFLRYFILSQYTDARKNGKPLTEDDLYDWLDKNQDRLGIAANPSVFAKSLLKAAQDYRDFVTKPSRHLKHINRLSGRARQHLMIMLAGQHLSTNSLDRVSARIEALFVAFLLTKEPTKALDLIFSNAAPRLRELTSKSTDADVEEFLSTHIESEIVKRSERINEAFLSIGLERKTIARFVLARLSQYTDEMASGISKDINDYWQHEIEHILPNNPTEEILLSFDKPAEYSRYKQRLGNLVLLEKSINASIGRNFYEEKKTAYIKSNIFMTRAIGETQSVGANTAVKKIAAHFPLYTAWQGETISKRQNDLLKLAQHVWSYPKD